MEQNYVTVTPCIKQLVGRIKKDIHAAQHQCKFTSNDEANFPILLNRIIHMRMILSVNTGGGIMFGEK